MTNDIVIREAQETDRTFIFELSPRLTEAAGMPWHTDSAITKMQDDYITQMLCPTYVPHITLIAERKVAENNLVPLGFIHARAHNDSISGETCGTIPLLAVSGEAQGMGVGKRLIAAAETWAKDLGYRLLHLEVFANNKNAYDFYKSQNFEAETIHMIKTL